jgi:hypothetical protein
MIADWRALDWTKFDEDDHATLCMYVVTSHGRATPLAWNLLEAVRRARAVEDARRGVYIG